MSACVRIGGFAVPGQQILPARDLTVIMPAFNDAESVGDTVRTIRSQTTPPALAFTVKRRPVRVPRLGRRG